jgi:hypothetical protein
VAVVTWAPDYCTLAEAKSYLNIDDSADDLFLAAWITTASRSVDNYCGRQFGQVASAETRTYTPRWDRTLGAYVAQIDDLFDTDDLIVIVGEVEITGFELLPENGPARGKPFTEMVLTGPGRVAADSPAWGWPTIPAPVKTSTLLQMARLAIRRDSPFGVAGSPSDSGGETRLLGAVLDPDLRVALTGFRREWWAV